jgi:hypothetical protein
MSSGFVAESTAVCAGAINTKSLAARAGVCGAGGPQLPGANAIWNTTGQVLLGDVAACDVASGDIASVSNSPCRKKVLALCGRRLGGKGESRRGKGQVFRWLSVSETGGQQFLTDVTARNHGSQR